MGSGGVGLPGLGARAGPRRLDRPLDQARGDRARDPQARWSVRRLGPPARSRGGAGRRAAGARPGGAGRPGSSTVWPLLVDRRRGECAPRPGGRARPSGRPGGAGCAGDRDDARQSGAGDDGARRGPDVGHQVAQSPEDLARWWHQDGPGSGPAGPKGQSAGRAAGGRGVPKATSSSLLGLLGAQRSGVSSRAAEMPVRARASSAGLASTLKATRSWPAASRPWPRLAPRR